MTEINAAHPWTWHWKGVTVCAFVSGILALFLGAEALTPLTHLSPPPTNQAAPPMVALAQVSILFSLFVVRLRLFGLLVAVRFPCIVLPALSLTGFSALMFGFWGGANPQALMLVTLLFTQFAMLVVARRGLKRAPLEERPRHVSAFAWGWLVLWIIAYVCLW